MTIKLVITQTCDNCKAERELNNRNDLQSALGDLEMVGMLGGWRSLSEGQNAMHICPRCIQRIKASS